MKGFIESILSSTSGTLSSKRLCGIVGFVSSVVILFYCSVKHIEAPTFASEVLYSSSALLGIDSITSIVKKGGSNE